MKMLVLNLLLLLCGMSWNSSAHSTIENKNLRDTIPIVYLGQIDFDFDRYTIKAKTYSRLDIFANLLKSNPNANLYLKGFGKENEHLAYSTKISYRRANAVKEHLITNYGFDENRITIAYDGRKCSCVKVYIDTIPTGYIGEFEFNLNKYTIESESWTYPNLSNFAELLNNNHTLNLYLKGFFKEEENETSRAEKISFPRVEAVKDTLVSKYNINQNRIKTTYNIHPDDCACVKAYIYPIPMTYLGQINFDSDKDLVKDIYYQRLQSTSILLKNNPDFQLKIIGFTLHNPMASERLSYNRATAIQDFLISNYEIKAERLIIEHYEEEPNLCSCVKLYLIE